MDTPPNCPSKNTLANADSVANIHLEKQATTTMDPVIISNNMTERLPDGSTMDSSHIATFHLPGIRKYASKNKIYPKNENSPTNIIGSLM